jgi:protein phosphatase
MNLKGILDVAGRSDTGRVRSHNEDHLDYDTQIGLIVLADGMGGYKGGEVASAIAVHTIVDSLKSMIPSLKCGEVDTETGYSRESLAARQSIINANEVIYKTSQSQPQYQGMGTTVVMGVFYNNQITVAHVGDSRMYRFRGAKLEQITVDHTLLQELVDRGFYSPEEAKESLNKNLVTRALGIETTVAVDIHEDKVFPGDIYLLCSDGLCDMVNDDDIHSIITTYGNNLDETADQLILRANENGGKDNVSVLLVRPNKAFPVKQAWYKQIIKWF